MNYFDPSVNSNKVWMGKAFDDGTFRTDFGRVRSGGQGMMNRVKKLSSGAAAVSLLETKRREKLSKGYRDTEVLNNAESEIIVASAKPADLGKLAVEQIEGASGCAATAELIKYLAEVNIHRITASTSIKYNAATSTFSTPLGVLTPAAIAEARKLLGLIENANGRNPRAQSRHEAVCNYYRLVPADFGVRIPKSENLLDAADKIQKQTEILDALEAAIGTAQTTTTGEKIFKCKLVKVPHWTEEGKAAFRKVKNLYESSKGGHASVAGLKLVRLYEVEIEDMKSNFEQAAAKLGNVRSDLWHGTKASNLLSILKNGLMIPKSSDAHCTGRMFGDGIYTSLQSTKALNYATNFWNGSGPKNQKTFMFLTECALGKMHQPKTSGGSFPKKGTDSTWIDAGTCGVINNEVIVYDTKQINLKYLCEFADAV